MRKAMIGIVVNYVNFISENTITNLKLSDQKIPEELNRKTLRLTVDNHEDFDACRIVYGAFKEQDHKIPIAES
jgi:spore coat polysaccharide biosynthesis protein SpsF (cytidylyltransferase family)